MVPGFVRYLILLF